MTPPHATSPLDQLIALIAKIEVEKYLKEVNTMACETRTNYPRQDMR